MRWEQLYSLTDASLRNLTSVCCRWRVCSTRGSWLSPGSSQSRGPWTQSVFCFLLRLNLTIDLCL